MRKLTQEQIAILEQLDQPLINILLWSQAGKKESQRKLIEMFGKDDLGVESDQKDIDEVLWAMKELNKLEGE